MDRIKEYQDERWKERARQIRELDGHKCAMCGAEGVLHVHHLAYPPAPFHIWDATDEELVTLCPDCHKKVHKSSCRVYLDKYRNVQGCNVDAFDIDEYTKWVQEQEQAYKDAKCSGKACCANCALGILRTPFLDCLTRINDDRDFVDVPFDYHCEEYQEHTCGNCKNFYQTEVEEGDTCGYCKACSYKGEDIWTHNFFTKINMICGDEYWELKH